jgi:hypothetical protein
MGDWEQRMRWIVVSNETEVEGLVHSRSNPKEWGMIDNCGASQDSDRRRRFRADKTHLFRLARTPGSVEETLLSIRRLLKG